VKSEAPWITLVEGISTAKPAGSLWQTLQANKINQQLTNDVVNDFYVKLILAIAALTIEGCGDMDKAKRLIAFLAPLLPSSRTIFLFHFVLSAVIVPKDIHMAVRSVFTEDGAKVVFRPGPAT
jgi:hypothetical protein